MNKKAIALSIIAVILSFIGGFLLANSLNRKELEELRTENARLQSNRKNAEEFTLSDEEIRRKIAEAEQNPDNFAFQKNLGIALYRYAGMKQDASFLPDVVKLLRRAAQLRPNDEETQVALGNAHLDLGQINKDKEAYKTARDFYAKALSLNPGNADVQNDLGLTYFLSDPPEYDRAIAEFQKALKIKTDHEKALENLVRVYLAQGKTKEAEEHLKRLKTVNPQNDFLTEFEAQLAQGKTNQ
jgi:Tfp pilus assembly protein PilF